MSNDCIFCKIVKKEIPAEIVFENDRVIAFFDIFPVNPGHLLVIPKEHYDMMTSVPDELLSSIFVETKHLMKKTKLVTNSDFVALSVVGTEVPHFHIHLVPRYFNDGMENFWPKKEYNKSMSEEIAKNFRE